MQFGSTASDASNFYYADISSPGKVKIFQLPLNANTPRLLYTGEIPAGTYSTYSPAGTVGTNLVIAYDSTPEVNGALSPTETTSDLYIVPIGKTSTAATKIGGPYEGSTFVYVNSLDGSETAKEPVFLTVMKQTGSGKTVKYAYSSAAIPAQGPYGQSLAANAAYAGFAVNGSSKYVFEVKGIKETNFGWGGGTINLVNVATGTSTPLSTAGSANYVIPTGHALQAEFLGSFNSGAAAGVLFNTTNVLSIGVAIDLNQKFLLPISEPKTNVNIF